MTSKENRIQNQKKRCIIEYSDIIEFFFDSRIFE